jgi:hypothetical protein
MVGSTPHGRCSLLPGTVSSDPSYPFLRGAASAHSHRLLVLTPVQHEFFADVPESLREGGIFGRVSSAHAAVAVAAASSDAYSTRPTTSAPPLPTA